MCSSGDSTAKQGEQQSNEFQKQLMDAFHTQFGQNQAITKFLTDTLTPGVSNPKGYDDATLAAMRTGATDNISNQYQNAQKALNSRQALNGGAELPSGVNQMQQGSLAMAQAGDTANAQNSITVQDANLKQQNYWNSVNALNGVNAGNNALGTAGAANGAGGTTASLSNAVSNSQATAMSPFNALIGAAGGAGAAALYGKKP